MAVIAPPSRNFDPLYQKQNETKSKLNAFANDVDDMFPGSGQQFRDLATSINFHNTAEVNIFNPDNPCSAFGFIEAAGDLFGFDPESFDYYNQTREALDKMYDVAYSIPVAILTEIDNVLNPVFTTVDEVNEVYGEATDKYNQGVSRVNEAINVFSNIRDRIDKDKKKLLFVLAAITLPQEDVQLFLERAKFFEMTVLEPCQNYYKAKIVGDFRDEYGLIDAEAIFKQKDKLSNYIKTLPDDLF